MVSHTEAQHGTGKDTGTCIRVAVCHTAPPGSSRAAHLPPIEVQGCELPKVGIAHVHVERLALVNIGPAVGRHVHQHPLFNLPHCLVQRLQTVRNV